MARVTMILTGLDGTKVDAVNAHAGPGSFLEVICRSGGTVIEVLLGDDVASAIHEAWSAHTATAHDALPDVDIYAGKFAYDFPNAVNVGERCPDCKMFLWDVEGDIVAFGSLSPLTCKPSGARHIDPRVLEGKTTVNGPQS